MRRVLTLLLTSALVASLLGVSRTPSQAAPPTPSSISVRLAPDRVTVFDNGAREPTGVVAQVSPAVAGRPVLFERREGSSWLRVGAGTSDATGRAYLPLTVTATGSSQYRVGVAASRGFRAAASGVATLSAFANTSCRPAPGPVDGSATGEATCLLARLDRWRAAGLMGVGQQVNISTKTTWDVPLRDIAAPAVVGFDLQELDQAATTAFPYDEENIAGLLERARAGAVLVASWHATNPFTGEAYDSSRRSLRPLLSPRSDAERVVHDRFWADWDAKLALLERFEIGDADGDGAGDGPNFNEFRTAVVVRPLHEVNGDFFWWGKPDRDLYKQLFSRLQDRAAQRGVNNILWAYSGNRDTSSTTDPADYTPYRVDIGGLDTYDPEFGKHNARDRLGLEGYRALAARLRQQQVPRMALTEVGPHGSTDGSWNPAVISRAVRVAEVTPLWAMLWFDDGRPRPGSESVGRKQISSLSGGRAWLRSCLNSLCHLR